MKSLLILLILTLPFSTFGVSRIGGGKVGSLASGFVMELPSPFLALDQFEDVVVANGPIGFSADRIVPQYIQIREFDSLFGSLSGLDRSALRREFKNRGWTLQSDSNPCFEVFKFQNSSATGIAITWGQGKGVSLQGPALPSVAEAIGTARSNLTLKPGACSWK